MTTIINHRVNTLEKLRQTPTRFGVEIDLRSEGKRIILHHEPFAEGVDFEAFLKEYHHGTLILNVKSEGIERKVLELVEKYGINDYFFLDITFPFMIKYIKEGWKKMACRFSEFESIETCLNLKGKVEWVFVDNFTKLPIENAAFETLKKHFKICIVSPELLHRTHEIPFAKDIAQKYGVDAVLTDHLAEWES